MQTLAGLRTGLVNGGPGTAMRHLARGLNAEGHLQELIGGLSQLSVVESLNREFAARGEDVSGAVDRIARFIRNPRRVTASFTGSDKAAGRVRDALTEWLSRMESAPLADEPTGFRPYDDVPRLGLAASMQVAHCVQLVPAPPPSHPDIPLIMVGLGILRLDYMVSELRFKGNAYGANCGYTGNGLLSLSTYADPHITRTLGVYARLADYIRSAPWTQTEIDHGIINTAKNALAPIRPEDGTGTALSRHLAGQTPAFRETQYARLLAATPREVKRALLDVLDANFAKAPVCVLSSREKLEQANREMPDRPLAIEDILK